MAAEPVGHQAGGATFGRGESSFLLAEQPDDDVLELVVLLAEDQRAEALADRGHGRLDGRETLLLGRPLGGDPQHDRGLAGGDAHGGAPAAADQVGQHRLDLAFAGPETMDIAAGG